MNAGALLQIQWLYIFAQFPQTNEVTNLIQELAAKKEEKNG